MRRLQISDDLAFELLDERLAIIQTRRENYWGNGVRRRQDYDLELTPEQTRALREFIGTEATSSS